MEKSRPHPCEFWEYLQQFLSCEPTPTIQEPVPTPTEPITYEPPVMTQPTPIVGFDPVQPSVDRVYYYHGDHLNSSTYVTDDNGRPVAYYDYLPFGEVAVEHNQTTNFNNGYKFNGKELDETTGMSYYGARYYDSRLSVFVSVDPLAEETMTPYQYCYNNPVNFIDPTGMKGEWIPGTDGEAISYSINSEGNVEWSNNTPDNFKELGNTMLRTAKGREQLDKALNANDVKLTVNFKEGRYGKEKSYHSTSTFGITKTNLVQKDKMNDKYIKVLDADIDLYPKAYSDLIEFYIKKPKETEPCILTYDGYSTDIINNTVIEHLSTTFGHEIEHVFDPKSSRTIINYNGWQNDPEENPNRVSRIIYQQLNEQK